jgi:hypothetical protein
MTYAKAMLAVLLAVWNANLFINTIPGWMGYFTAFIAINLEATAFYCVHNYFRSEGKHQEWLGKFAIILGGFSLLHCVFAIIHYTGYGKDAWVVSFYSNVLALPIIVVLISIAVATLAMSHPAAGFIRQLAKAKMDAMIKRAKVLIEQAKIADVQDLIVERAALFDTRTRIKNALLPIIDERLGAEADLQAKLASITDPHLRNQIQTDISGLWEEDGSDQEVKVYTDLTPTGQVPQLPGYDPNRP